MDEKENIENLNSNQDETIEVSSNQDGIEMKSSSMEDSLNVESSDMVQEKSATDKALDDFLFSDEPIEESLVSEETKEVEKEPESKIAIEEDVEKVENIEKTIEESIEQEELDETKLPEEVSLEEVAQKVETLDEEESISQSNELITVRPVKFPKFEQTPPVRTIKKNLDIMQDVSMHVSVELGRTKSSIREVMEMEIGSIVELDKIAGEQVEVFVNDKLVAKGEVIVIEDKFGVRITSTNIVKNNA